MNEAFSANPFIRADFWGRANEIAVISERLRSPQSIPIIGEPFIGKTTLLRQLRQLASDVADEYARYIYLDCEPYIQRARELPGESAYLSTQFRWEVFSELRNNNIIADEKHEAPRRNQSDDELFDIRYEINSTVEETLRAYNKDHPGKPVIFLLDNFEGIAHLHVSNVLWLRSLAASDLCALVVTSRYAIYILLSHHPDSLNSPSPLWNIFTDPLYLELMRDEEVRDFLAAAKDRAAENGSRWLAQDIQFIRRMAGRHPELLRIACARMFDERIVYPMTEDDQATPDYSFLALRIQQDAKAICSQLWQGLADRALLDELDAPAVAGADTNLSVFQQALLDITYCCLPKTTNVQVLFMLEQRGLIEQVEGEWRIFSEIMSEFVRKQGQAAGYVTPTTVAPLEPFMPTQDEQGSDGKDGDRAFSFTSKESKVYEYLKAHKGEVCDRDAIMRAVWGTDSATSYSALQKAIERLRSKIEDDLDSPYKLISVRGRGYLLRRT